MLAAERLADPDDSRLDVWEERMLDAVDLYVGTWPDEPKATALGE